MLGSVAKFFLMNLESCMSLNLWCPVFDFARKTKLCDRTPRIMLRNAKAGQELLLLATHDGRAYGYHFRKS